MEEIKSSPREDRKLIFVSFMVELTDSSAIVRHLDYLNVGISRANEQNVGYMKEHIINPDHNNRMK
jgi:hypothetical protein